MILGRKPWHFLPPPGPGPHEHSLKMNVHFEARHSSQNRTCPAQAHGNSLLLRNGNIRSLLAPYPEVTLGHVQVPFFLTEEVPKEQIGEGEEDGEGVVLSATDPGRLRSLRRGGGE